MAIPASADELERFTPPSLRNLPTPPSFLLKPATGRDLRLYEHRIMAEGLISHSVEDFRAAMLEALEGLYSPELFAQAKGRLVSYWTLLDQNGKPAPEEERAVQELTSRLIRSSRRVSEMAADNARFNSEVGRIAVAMYVAGWKGLEVVYARDDGAVPLERIDALEIELAAMEREGQAEDVKVEGVEKPGTAFAQLSAEAFKRLLLTEAERKNLSSPSPSTATPNGSRRRSSKRTAGRRSKATASSGSAAAN